MRSNKQTGMVFLVGAGPGDPGLITVKGLNCIARADVIVYDYLASPALLAHANPDAEMIYVGKKGGDHTLPQDGINALIVEKANRETRWHGSKGVIPSSSAVAGKRLKCSSPRGSFRGRPGRHRRHRRLRLCGHPPDPPGLYIGRGLRYRPRRSDQGRIQY